MVAAVAVERASSYQRMGGPLDGRILCEELIGVLSRSNTGGIQVCSQRRVACKLKFGKGQAAI
jgi:hypothetical protein